MAHLSGLDNCRPTSFDEVSSAVVVELELGEELSSPTPRRLVQGDMMGSDKLRDELRASFKHRAILYYRIFEELRTEVGVQQAIAVLKRAIYRRGEEVGRQFREFAPNDLAGLKDAFLAIIPDQGRTFEPHVERCDAESLVIHLKSCPLKDAWEELGLDDHDKAVMCEIAGEVDRGTFEAAGFSIEPDTWKPGRSGCCQLNICPKS